MYYSVKMIVIPTLRTAGVEQNKRETSKKERGETHNKLNISTSQNSSFTYEWDNIGINNLLPLTHSGAPKSKGCLD